MLDDVLSTSPVGLYVLEQELLCTESPKANILCVLSLLQITCLDISSGGGLGVSTSTDGTMKIWQAANGEIRVRAAALFGVVLSLTLQCPAMTWGRLSACCGQAGVWFLIEKLMGICTS